jgi:hypothetical protein
MAMNFTYKYLFSYLQGYFTCYKILPHRTGGFTSSPKEVMLQIVITLKNPSSLVRFEHANLGSGGKHDNHYTTDGDAS